MVSKPARERYYPQPARAEAVETERSYRGARD